MTERQRRRELLWWARHHLMQARDYRQRGMPLTATDELIEAGAYRRLATLHHG